MRLSFLIHYSRRRLTRRSIFGTPLPATDLPNGSSSQALTTTTSVTTNNNMKVNCLWTASTSVTLSLSQQLLPMLLLPTTATSAFSVSHSHGHGLLGGGSVLIRRSPVTFCQSLRQSPPPQRTTRQTALFFSSRSSSSERDLIQDPTTDPEDEESLDVSTTSLLPFASTYHAPVMWKECIEGLLGCERGQKQQQRTTQNEEEEEEQRTNYNGNNNNNNNNGLIFVDGTLGGGGHSEALLQALKPGDVVFGCDVDPNALAEASKRLKAYMRNNDDDDDNTSDDNNLPLFVPVQANFCQLATVLPRITYPNSDQRILPTIQHSVDGILLDLGVSSHQIDTAERGFAFMKDGPLDMRMMSASTDNSSSSSNLESSSSSSLTAADLCNELEETELADIFIRYGDEERGRARSIARSIVQHRPLRTTGQLRQAVARVVPDFHKKSKRKGKTATSARIFQSLRIVVNREDEVLQQVLEDVCPRLLRQGGRLAVLSYHSMEDRATKRVMRDGTTAKQRGSPERDIYGDYIGPAKPFRPVGKFQKASDDEIAHNSRARSATLRIAERLQVVVATTDSENDDDEGR